MKKQFIIFLVTLLFLTACNEEQYLVVSHSSGVKLMDVPVVISRDALNAKSSLLPVLQDESGSSVPTQLEDLDLNGLWDQMLLQCEISPEEKLKYRIDWVEESEYPKFDNRTNVHLGVSKNRDNQFLSTENEIRPKGHVAQSTPFLYQYEGPGWESELVGFRSYFDSRNGKDIFGKTIPELTLHEVGLKDNYHKLDDWGMDVLKVGSSLGAGAIGMVKNDSIYRLGQTEEAKFEILSNGPLKSTFKLTYNGWKIEDAVYGLEETITIWGGKRWYQSELTLIGGTPQDTLVSGIVDLKKADKEEFEYKNSRVLYTHGLQSENRDHLGMAIILSEEDQYGFGQAPTAGDGVVNSYIAYLKSNDNTYRFIFYAGWEKENEGFALKDYFEKELISTIESLNQSIDIQVQ